MNSDNGFSVDDGGGSGNPLLADLQQVAAKRSKLISDAEVAVPDTVIGREFR